jgi:AAHS family 4-hydroxybenzoate transporter-like MFS transporter
MNTRETSLDVGHVLDSGSWGGYQKWLVALVALTIVFDGIDNQLLGIVIPTVMREWDVQRSAFASVISLGYVGMMIGGAVAGVVGDRVGRRTALLGSMVVFGVMTVVAPLADNTTTLGILRLLAGLGLGGAMPNAAALAAEYVPARRRPIAVTVTIVCVPLGGTLAGLLGIRLLPVLGWEALFVIGGLVPVVAAVALRWLLPESPRFLARHESRWPELEAVLRRMGHQVAPGTRFVDLTDRTVGKATVSTLFTPEYQRDTIALWCAFFSCLLAVYLGFSWLTSLLTSAGFDPATANSGITAFNLGGVVGALVGGVAIARFGSRAAMLTMTISPSVALFPIMAMLTLTGSMINGVQTTMYALAAHVYPSAVRSTGVGTAVAFGRSGAVLTGYVGTWAIGLGGTTAFFGVVAGMMVLAFAALASVRKHVPAR